MTQLMHFITTTTIPVVLMYLCAQLISVLCQQLGLYCTRNKVLQNKPSLLDVCFILMLLNRYSSDFVICNLAVHAVLKRSWILMGWFGFVVFSETYKLMLFDPPSEAVGTWRGFTTIMCAEGRL